MHTFRQIQAGQHKDKFEVGYYTLEARQFGEGAAECWLATSAWHRVGPPCDDLNEASRRVNYLNGGSISTVI